MTILSGFFNPNSVAVVGASANVKKVGNAVLKNIITSGFKGAVYPVNPHEEVIEGLKCYPTLTDIGSDIDLVVTAIPAKHCLDIAEEAGSLGIKNLIIISAGFKEAGSEGMELEKKLFTICSRYGINMLGPNCVGYIDTVIPINASFSAAFPKKGNIAFISQSGAMMLSVIDWSLSAGLGFSRVISLGNKAQLNEADFFEALANDDNTKVILAYIEDVSSGERFIEAAKKATCKKPLIVFKSGTSQAGALAASSHTGALVGSDPAYKASFEKAGIIRARSITELFDLAKAFSYQPLPNSGRIAVVTNAGGPGIVASDAIEHHNLTMARFTKETIEKLREALPTEANIYNPIDVLGDADADRYRLALEKTLTDPNVDCVLMLICPTAITDEIAIAKTITELHQKHPDKPIFTSFMGGPNLNEGVKIVTAAGIPNYTFPEPAVCCIKGMVDYSEAVNKLTVEDGDALNYQDVDKNMVKAIFYDVFRDRRRVLLGSEAHAVADAYGIPTALSKLATTIEEAVQLAEKIGYPVVLKVASPKILHKTDVGGVLTDINNAEEVREGFIKIMESVQRYLPDVVPYGIEVQKMMPPGTEIIIGITKDIHFGPIIAFGLGGVFVNLLKDVSFRLAKNITASEIQAMINDTKAFTLLRGYRGEQPKDILAVMDVIARVAKLVNDFPEITEMDINPIHVYQQGLSALDIKITIS